ncbi:hypothetical protein KKA14_21805 [bacterium]|nr:hypothetical protein [bacterium]
MKIPSRFLLLISVLLFIQGFPTRLNGQLKNSPDSALLKTQKFLNSLGKKFSVTELTYLKKLNLANLEITDKNIHSLNSLKQLRTLILSDTQISGKTLGDLSKNSQLKTLELENIPLREDLLDSISKIKPLTRLNISNTALTDKGLLPLTNLKNLQTLNISGTQVSNTGMEIIGKIKSLRSLNLARNQLSNPGLKSLSQLKNLDTLVLSETLIDDDGLKYLLDLPSLKFLDLSDTRISNNGLKYLKTIIKLSHLNLANTDIDNKGLSDIFDFKNLNYISISGTQISYVDFMNLKSSMPTVEINAHYVIIPPEYKTDINRIFGNNDPEMEIKTAPIVDISIKDPLIVGLAIPFEIAFINPDGLIDRNYHLKSDLVFNLKNTPFTLSSGKAKKSGQDTIILPSSEINFANGIVSGTISVERISNGRTLVVYRKSPDKEGLLEYLGSFKIDMLFSDVEKVVFSKNHLEANTGEELEIKISVYNYLGQKIEGKVGKTIHFLIQSNHALIIDGKQQLNTFNIHPSRFSKGEALIRIKAEKQGQYVLSYHGGQTIQGSGMGKQDNSISIKIESSI